MRAFYQAIEYIKSTLESAPLLNTIFTRVVLFVGEMICKLTFSGFILLLECINTNHQQL